MAFIPVPKTLLLLVLLSVISAGPARAQTPQVYRFGSWTLIAPAEVTPEALATGPHPISSRASGVEFLAYWQDGAQRALALRFDGSDGAKDLVALKSHHRSHRIKGCGLGGSARIAPLSKALPKDVEPVEFPDGGAVSLSGTDRGVRRAGELLVVDQGPLRVQLTEDSPLVRAGAWASAEFCRFELSPVDEDDGE